MKSTPVLIFALLSILLASCAKLPVYQSKSYVQPEKQEFTNSFSNNYDEKTNVKYGIADNDTNFYIQAVFHDRESLMKIMRGGLNVYFDPEGKKKKLYQLKIEKSENQKLEKAMSPALLREELGGQQNMTTLIAKIYNKITWDKNGKEFVFYRNLLKDPISVEFIPGEQNELVLEIKMPLSEIPLQDGLNLFSLGIETGSSSSAGMTGGRPNSGMRPSGGMGGGRGGGGGMRGGGGRGGAGGGMRSGGGSRHGGSASSGTEPIRIWFQVQL